MEAGRGLDWSLGRLGLAAICALAGLALVAPRAHPRAAAGGVVSSGNESATSDEPAPSEPLQSPDLVRPADG